MLQRSWLPYYLRTMAREIQWDEVRIQREWADLDTHAEWTAMGPRTWAVLRNGVRYKVECESGPDEEGQVVIRINGARQVVRVLDDREKLLEKMGMAAVAGAASLDVKAPMPGKVLQVLVNVGDDVEEGQPLLVLEAMKMENMINASASGQVTVVPVSEGEAVEKGALLVGFEA